jgi:DNA-binding Lrp family transcriptional regulator
MEDKKKKLLTALKQNAGRSDEATVGESIGLTESELNQALTELVNEGKLEFQSFGICNYVPTGR